MVALALYQPDIAANTGTIARLCACMGVTLHVIEPCGFPFNDAKFKRAAMDYWSRVKLVRHPHWSSFIEQVKREGARLVLMETGHETELYDFAFQPDDIILLGRESAGTPPEIAEQTDAWVGLSMAGGERSLNVAIAAGMALGEAMRQVRHKA
ncbi:tRNA methyltransferase [bacterium]|nr:tRNA methyltransferase [bacterium]